MNWTLQQLQDHLKGMGMPGEPPLPRQTNSRPVYRSKTEGARALALDLDVKAGAIRGWQYEAITLRLAAGVRYTPDFLIEHLDGTVSFDEVKGRKALTFFSRPVGKIKIAIAARLFPYWRFRVVCPGSRLGTWDAWTVSQEGRFERAE